MSLDRRLSDLEARRPGDGAQARRVESVRVDLTTNPEDPTSWATLEDGRTVPADAVDKRELRRWKRCCDRIEVNLLQRERPC
jgi:hypothetical protein